MPATIVSALKYWIFIISKPGPIKPCVQRKQKQRHFAQLVSDRELELWTWSCSLHHSQPLCKRPSSKDCFYPFQDHWQPDQHACLVDNWGVHVNQINYGCRSVFLHMGSRKRTCIPLWEPCPFLACSTFFNPLILMDGIQTKGFQIMMSVKLLQVPW